MSTKNFRVNIYEIVLVDLGICVQ